MFAVTKWYNYFYDVNMKVMTLIVVLSTKAVATQVVGLMGFNGLNRAKLDRKRKAFA